jgi:hypothetical protein
MRLPENMNFFRYGQVVIAYSHYHHKEETTDIHLLALQAWYRYLCNTFSILSDIVNEISKS